MSNHGNRITENAFNADSGEGSIDKAIEDIQKLGWTVSNKDKFAGAHGVYYDSKKVGSFFVEVKNNDNLKGVLKLQLRPLPYDEGFIIRHIDKHNKSKRIRTPKIYLDAPWSESVGYGYLIFEDLSGFPNIWANSPPQEEKEFSSHKEFLKEFLRNVLPMEPFLKKPSITPLESARRSFDHFFKIAQNSNHKHISKNEVLEYKKKYFETLEKVKDFEDLHFSHGHLTGMDIKQNPENGDYIVLANLYWGWRPMYHELTFPIWNSLMRIRKKNLRFEEFLGNLDRWCGRWSSDLFDYNPTKRPQFWVNLFSSAMHTIMLDLGASEWKEEDHAERLILLTKWKEFFDWILEHKLKIKYE